MEYKDLNPEVLEKAASLLKAIAHPIRISIINYLDDGKMRTVTEIHKQLAIEQAIASHHLVILKDKGVLSSKREGRNIWYSLNYTNMGQLLNCIKECCG